MTFHPARFRVSFVRFIAAATLAGAAGAAQAQAVVIQNCVGGPPITLGATDSHAMLDNADREQVHAAILSRYPALAADGFAPQKIMMWRKNADVTDAREAKDAKDESNRGWLYASLMSNDEHPETLCFNANFSAGMFDFTPALTQKYFFAGAERT